ncbi:hypothetical protein V8C37DRAFT_369531 [Trichoderma ceciliae]
MWFDVTLYPSLETLNTLNTYMLKQFVSYPIRRLVITGKDTPENFRLLFGTDQLGRSHKEQRRNVLLMSLQHNGSPAAKMQGFFDKGCPEFAPRPASDAEMEELSDFISGYQEAASLLREVSQR